MAQQNKEQKKLLSEIMEADQKNGLYEEPTEIDDWLNEYGDPEIYKKVERKLELMEAAERFYPISKEGSMWMPSAEDLNKANKQEGFIEGANWQQERSYSEEDLRNAYRWGTTVNHGTKEHFNEWFEQFKKK